MQRNKDRLKNVSGLRLPSRHQNVTRQPLCITQRRCSQKSSARRYQNLQLVIPLMTPTTIPLTQGYSAVSPDYCPSFQPLEKDEPTDIALLTGTAPHQRRTFLPIVAHGVWTPPCNYPPKEERNA